MRYVVGILYAPTSNDADVKSVVRASNTDDAIISLMKVSDLGYVYAAYAYPSRSDLKVLLPLTGDGMYGAPSPVRYSCQ